MTKKEYARAVAMYQAQGMDELRAWLTVKLQPRLTAEMLARADKEQ